MPEETGFFDFLQGMPHYADGRRAAVRLNRRHAMLIAPHRAEIAGARVLDLAAHDGRWSYAFAAAGAAHVVGIEARAELIAQFAAYPEDAAKARVELREDDLYEGMEAALRAGERYDVVGVFGILYHVMDHFRLFQLVRRLGARLVIVDSEFLLRGGPVIQLVREKTDQSLNAAPQFEGQRVAIKGVPSFRAMEQMAEALDFSVAWADWDAVPKGARTGVSDYFRPAKMRRGTCVLRPLAG